MPYGIPDNFWSNMNQADQAHAQARVENARAGRGQYGSVEAAKAANARQWGSIFQPVGPLQGVGPSYMPGVPQEDVSAADQSTDNSGDGSGSGSGSDGGGGGFVRPSLASSPEWLAYLNSLGLEENQFRADIDRQRGLAQSQADYQIAAMGPQYQRARTNIAESLSTRGMSQSGEAVRRFAENRSQQGAAQGTVQNALATQLSGLESQLANRLIDLGSRRAQQELQLRTQGYQ